MVIRIDEEKTAERDRWFLKIADVVAERSTCNRGNVGAVVVHDRRIISMGYNGAPPGMKHCTDVGCEIAEVPVDLPMEHGPPLVVPVPELGCQRSIHAEANAIAWAARSGLPTNHCTMYSTHGPCLTCARLILASGIECVVYRTPYRIPHGLELLDEAGVILARYE